MTEILNFFEQEVIITEVVDAKLTDNYELKCYPNPFTSQSMISFSLPYKDNVDLSIYNIQGHKVSTLVSEENLPSGIHNYKIEGSLLPQGICYAVLTTKATKSSIKLVIIH
jgi:hypothetical protein